MRRPPPPPDLPPGLLMPQAYPHAVVQPIRVVETHVSWILLTGPYAYKIKKPLKLSFLDYSTLERRRVLCNEELRLNRRYAPDLYVDVVTISASDSKWRVSANDEAGALEYAVRMRQFNTDDELGALLDARAVGAPELAELGEHMARFHAQATPAAEHEDFGLPAAVHQVTLNNFTELSANAQASGWQEPMANLRRRADTMLTANRAMMVERKRQGSVRECHGDLHCGNVVRWHGALTPFDGIEFDPALRFIDVVSDIAFLSMDLAACGRADLRHALLNRWAEVLGDYEGLALLPYFECYRALVRAKVSALFAAQLPSGSASAVAALDKAGHYLRWADAQGNAVAPRLILTCGVSGSGKTWLARRLAEELPALHVRSDVERKRLTGLEPLADSRSTAGSGIYTQELTELTYERLRDCAKGCLRGGENVIVDATFLTRRARMPLLYLAAELNVPLAILHCSAPPDVLRKRIESRQRGGRDASEADKVILERQLFATGSLFRKRAGVCSAGGNR